MCDGRKWRWLTRERRLWGGRRRTRGTADYCCLSSRCPPCGLRAHTKKQDTVVASGLIVKAIVSSQPTRLLAHPSRAGRARHRHRHRPTGGRWEWAAIATSAGRSTRRNSGGDGRRVHCERLFAEPLSRVAQRGHVASERRGRRERRGRHEQRAVRLGVRVLERLRAGTREPSIRRLAVRVLTHALVRVSQWALRCARVSACCCRCRYRAFLPAEVRRNNLYLQSSDELIYKFERYEYVLLKSLYTVSGSRLVNSERRTQMTSSSSSLRGES